MVSHGFPFHHFHLHHGSPWPTKAHLRGPASWSPLALADRSNAPAGYIGDQDNFFCDHPPGMVFKPHAHELYAASNWSQICQNAAVVMFASKWPSFLGDVHDFDLHDTWGTLAYFLGIILLNRHTTGQQHPVRVARATGSSEWIRSSMADSCPPWQQGRWWWLSIEITVVTQRQKMDLLLRW